ncbi:hypothetical protein, partial [Streptococcus anginosus]|uniref:hypothetical protein n=1 Tax=Streptococcus anginosus TaxID=1328 RepID=UPI002ED82492
MRKKDMWSMYDNPLFQDRSSDEGGSAIPMGDGGNHREDLGICTDIQEFDRRLDPEDFLHWLYT